MYAPFFGLQHPPFSIAPDPRYLFMSERHREALAHLLYGLDAGGGFVLLTGEVGAGKTTVCRCFLEQIPPHCNVAYIFNPKLTVGELLRSICDEFGVPHRPSVAGVETVKDYIDPLNASLLAAHGAGRNTVLIIDEAQNLSADVLEQLRLLTNLETSERKLLQIILIGQPELRTMVASPALEQLAQRVIARFHLDALSAQETQQYIAHRLAVAGLQGPLPFSRSAIRRVHTLSRGIPRRINLLCDRALLGAYAAGVREVSARIVQRAAAEVFDAPASAAAARSARGLWPRWAVAGLGVVAGAALVAGGWALGTWPQWSRQGAVSSAVPAGAMTSKTSASAPPSGAASTAGVTPAAPASGALAPRGAAPVAMSDLQQFVAALPASDTAAWQVLASAWGASVADGADACAALPREGLRCYRNRRAGLNLVRQIDRPVLLTLFPSEEGDVAVSAVLRRLDGDTATLEGGGRTVRVPVAELAQVWRGDIATLWRTPPDMPDKGDLAETPAGAAWLDQQLATAAAGGTRAAVPAAGRATTPAQRQSRIQRFQLAQGVTPDGRAGPLTLMLLNRVNGVSEPRLRTGG
ncbi:peptidoglycan-binding protein [Acidovorax sp. HMWF018]|uniref:AAA family ATPase n=1 Tax=Acidovorax sp. HMWF018 TaxID=2056855 RepID=UPI000D3DA0F9|nr:AAA family ATPase [Acidovorax sp. HMWF018]PTT43463.1 peptidoglycan-binding protein [Acidovorax sp. HMWF018]